MMTDCGSFSFRFHCRSTWKHSKGLSILALINMTGRKRCQYNGTYIHTNDGFKSPFVQSVCCLTVLTTWLTTEAHVKRMHIKKHV